MKMEFTVSLPANSVPYEELTTLGEHLRKRRSELGLLQKEVAQRLCVSKQTYRYWETGRHLPESRQWRRIIAFLGYDPHPRPQGLAGVLQQARRELGFTIKELAERIGVDESTVSDWEIRNRRPTRRTLPKLKKFLESEGREGHLP